MKKFTMLGIAGVAVAFGLGAALTSAMPSGDDRVKEGCIMGDLVYETRDGAMGIVEGSAECYEAMQPAVYEAPSAPEGDVMPVMLE